MSDHTAAQVFARRLQLLANDPTPEKIHLAAGYWNEKSNYDFSTSQIFQHLRSPKSVVKKLRLGKESATLPGFLRISLEQEIAVARGRGDSTYRQRQSTARRLRGRSLFSFLFGGGS